MEPHALWKQGSRSVSEATTAPAEQQLTGVWTLSHRSAEFAASRGLTLKGASTLTLERGGVLRTREMPVDDGSKLSAVSGEGRWQLRKNGRLYEIEAAVPGRSLPLEIDVSGGSVDGFSTFTGGDVDSKERLVWR